MNEQTCSDLDELRAHVTVLGQDVENLRAQAAMQDQQLSNLKLLVGLLTVVAGGWLVLWVSVQLGAQP
jgi:hypothetical protein